MTVPPPSGLAKPNQMDCALFFPTCYPTLQAEYANQQFDNAVRQYLRCWVIEHPALGAEYGSASENALTAFIEQDALRHFFGQYPDALERLLEQDDLSRHLLRPSHEVYFQPDAYEPLLATFEKRIYNLSAHHKHHAISFRYSPVSRQNACGDSIALADMPAGQAREDIGVYFGTRRSDETALNLLGRQLRREALFSPVLPIHVVTEGYMVDSLRTVRKITEQLTNEAGQPLHCFVIQRRHAADDRHLGAALLLMNLRQPNQPRRIIFCDTLNPHGTPPWWNKFKQYVDEVFPQPTGHAPVSERLEDGGVNLQRLHDGVPIRHQDIDCAFYSASMARALIQLAKLSPDLLINGSIHALVSAMTERMPEYFAEPNKPKNPEWVREVNILRRWETGQAVLADLRSARMLELTATPATLSDLSSLHWNGTDSADPCSDLSVAA
ncbi:hypothetical protein [Spirosoma montaniterrae]|uniref:hypothetical protein n=1 Tax=Spirosoma montaniterrae TaxID=1178516 RepID=UPI0018DB6917|nr:hypothetical protein [Spirosoma montaniterrae]